MSGHTPWNEIRHKVDGKVRKPRLIPTCVAIHVSRADIERFEPPCDCIIISVTDPGSADARIPVNPRIKAVYRVPKFHDIDGTDGEILRMQSALAKQDPATYVFFDEERAKALATFIKTVETSVTGLPPLLVAHCEAGICRSSAIAAALQSYYRLDGTSAFNTGIPNRLVYRLTLNALREKTNG